MNRPIRNSAKALIIKDGKMLAIKLDDNSDVFYIMPGGGQEAEEQLSDVACREVAEELGIKVIRKELVFVIEGVNGERFHRVDLIHRQIINLFHGEKYKTYLGNEEAGDPECLE